MHLASGTQGWQARLGLRCLLLMEPGLDPLETTLIFEEVLSMCRRRCSNRRMQGAGFWPTQASEVLSLPTESAADPSLPAH